MPQIDYIKIIKDAWKITWKNHYLWWFGFFITLSNIGSFSYYFGDSENKSTFKFEQQKIFDFISQNIHWFILVIVGIFIIYLFFVILGLIGRGALIDSIEKNYKGQKVNFKSAFRKGKKNFGKIFSIALILGLFIFSVIVVLATPVVFLFSSHNYLLGSLMTVMAFIIFIPLIILVNFLRLYSYIYAVLGKLNFWASLENAYNLFRKNILSSIIMGLFFIPINFALAMFFFALMLLLAIIFFGAGLIFYLLAGNLGIIIITSLGLIIFLLIILISQSIYQVFAQAVWIFFFHKIATPKIPELVAETETKTISKPIPIIEAKKRT